jgi:hypothetical protein
VKAKKKLPSIEIEGKSEESFEFRDGKIVRVKREKKPGSE